MTKTCTKCGKEYGEPFEVWFSIHKNNKDGFSFWCKNCRKAYRTKVKLRIKKYNGKYYDENNGRERSTYARWKRYGLMDGEYNAMFSSQKGKCAICGKHQSELKKPLGVDHSHDTGKVRGLLCFKCNTGIGMLEDSAESCLRAYEYLNQGVV